MVAVPQKNFIKNLIEKLYKESKHNFPEKKYTKYELIDIFKKMNLTNLELFGVGALAPLFWLFPSLNKHTKILRPLELVFENPLGYNILIKGEKI